jgi:hypothetical protein
MFLRNLGSHIQGQTVTQARNRSKWQAEAGCFELALVIFDFEDGICMFPRKIGKLVPAYKGSHPEK